jgi:hypothetical protein
MVQRNLLRTVIELQKLTDNEKFRFENYNTLWSFIISLYHIPMQEGCK